MNDSPVITSTNEVMAIIDQVRDLADRHKKELGFLPGKAYDQIAAQGKVWVIAPKGKVIGFLVHGGRFPILRIFQVFVLPQFRKEGIAAALIGRLVAFGESHGYSHIVARVAADLPANGFWDRVGFDLVRQAASGGRASKRRINTRVRQLKTRSLLDQIITQPSERPSHFCSINFRPSPLRSRVYVIDINVLLDVLRERERYEWAGDIVKAALNNLVRLQVTSEFLDELQREAGDRKNDPLLQMARQLPSLPAVDDSILNKLIIELKQVVFPSGPLDGSIRATRRLSDLRHLASSICHQVFGFITSDAAILRSREEVRRRYGLDVVSPADFFDEPMQGEPEGTSAFVDDSQLAVGRLDDLPQERIHKFLKTFIDEAAISEVLHPGASGDESVQRCVRLGNELVGVAVWDAPTKLRPEARAFIFVDERPSSAELVIDHLIEIVIRSSSADLVSWLVLMIGCEQGLTKRLAVDRGFRQLEELGSRRVIQLKKAVLRDIVLDKEWGEFRFQFLRQATIELPQAMPRFGEVNNTGLSIIHDGQAATVSLFEFETMLSPGTLLFRGRDGLIAPIRKAYAEDLIGPSDRQRTLFPKKEALVRVEKAYFRNPANSKVFKPGKPIVFYVSKKGGGSGAAVGCGRVTGSAIISGAEVSSRFLRQGVLSPVEIEGVANKEGLVHAFTFDCFRKFRRTIPLKRLKELGCASGANLVTVEKLPYRSLQKLLEEGFRN